MTSKSATWRGHLAAWQSSNESFAAFCRKHASACAQFIIGSVGTTWWSACHNPAGIHRPGVIQADQAFLATALAAPLWAW